jgi:hypothetical protein
MLDMEVIMDIKQLEDGKWDLTELSLCELKKLNDNINAETEARRKMRFTELSTRAAEALNELKEEFPFATLWVPCTSIHSSDMEIDVLTEVDHFFAEDFTL